MTIQKLLRFIAPPYFEDPDKMLKGRIVYALSVIMILGFTPLVIGMWLAADLRGFPILIAISLAGLSLWLTIRGNIEPPSYIIPAMMLPAISYIMYLGNGIHDENVPGFLVVISLAALLIGKRGVVIYSILSSCILTGFALAEMYGFYVNRASFLTNFQTLMAQLLGPMGFAAICYVLIDSMTKTAERAKESERNLRSVNQELEKLTTTLEQRVSDRTRDIEVASKVSREIVQGLTLDELLASLAEKTKAGFGLYFVSVYLYKPETKQLVFAAGTGEAGERMLSEGKLYQIDAYPSLIAYAGREKTPVFVPNISASDVHFSNPHLPSAKSEAAIPMLIQDELVGVLGLQSEKEGLLNEVNGRIFIILAEQIAVAIKNAQLYAEQIHVSEQLRTIDKLKSQFLASMSHELRTPMNAIMNFVEIVSMGLVGPVTAEQIDLLDQALQSSRHLLHLINDVLDVSKIQAGQLTLLMDKNVNLYEEMNAVLGMAKPLLNDKPVRIIQDIDENLPFIYGDKRRIRQILLNLLSNAVKFTEEGTITLSAKTQGDKILFAVIDTGPGITPAAQSIIFEPFVQTEDGIKQAEGTGLGLPISRSLAEAHGGKLWVESNPGEGAAFYFTLLISQEEKTHE